MIKGKHLGPFSMLPAKPGTCSECAVNHPAHFVHNKDSLFYQYKFYNENGRWPTWEDAMAHCSEEVKSITRKTLTEHGVKIN